MTTGEASSTSPDAGKSSASAETASKTGSAQNAEANEASLPEVELTSEMLYRLLTAEIAFQRGNWQMAYVTMLSTAQQTRDPRLAHRAAEIALTAKQPEEAFNAVKVWRALAPNSEEATQYYLSFVVLGDNLEEAKPIIEERLREAAPATRGVLIFQVQRLLARAKDKDAAFSLLEQLLAPYSSMHETHLALAQGAFAKGDLQRARDEAQTALKDKPDSELAALTMAQVLPDKNDALRSLADFLARNPKARDVRMAYARMLVDQNQYEQARKTFEVLLKDQPKEPTLLYALGVLAAQMNDYQAAENYLTSYLNVLAANQDEERDPTQALLLLAQIAEERKDLDGALKWLSQVEPGEGYFGAQLKRAQIIGKRGDMAGARKVLTDLHASGEREETQVILTEGQILRDANRMPEAMNVLKAGLKRFPKNTELLYDYAMMAEKSNQLDAMESSLRKIIEIAPNNQHAYNALGYSLAERNVRLQEAYTLIEKALSLAPEDPFIMDSMGWVQYRMGRLNEAESLLRRAYELRPDAEIAAHLGEVLWIKGQKDAAQKLWRAAQTKDPQNDTLKSTLARLNVNL
ncbi:tetratricopeptide repeat protein [Noviherbaspirillum massiliense]|uniref:tetratricopeptide repeat protein n=1 Tax=Noviherbaspirillum massiliense TaxID=1465823 RepID=UPI00036C452E